MMNHVRNVSLLTKRLSSSLTLRSSTSVKQQQPTKAMMMIITNNTNDVNLVNPFDRSYYTTHSHSRSMSSTTTTTTPPSSDSGTRKEESQSNIAANQEWNAFQASIHQNTNNTSTTTTSTTTTSSTKTNTFTKKRRGGKTARRKAIKEIQLQKKLRHNPNNNYDPSSSSTTTTTMNDDHDKPKIIHNRIVPKLEYDEEEERRELQFPNLRYNDIETQSLLEEAYKNLPIRNGKRGTKNLKRQTNRWSIVRKNAAIKKQERIHEHVRRMEKRSRISREVREMKMMAERVIRVEDEDYKMEVLKKWALMNGFSSMVDDGDNDDVVDGGGDVAVGNDVDANQGISASTK